MDKKGSVNFGENKSWVVPRNSWTLLAASFVDPSSSSLSLKTSSSTVVRAVRCFYKRVDVCKSCQSCKTDRAGPCQIIYYSIELAQVSKANHHWLCLKAKQYANLESGRTRQLCALLPSALQEGRQTFWMLGAE